MTSTQPGCQLRAFLQPLTGRQTGHRHGTSRRAAAVVFIMGASLLPSACGASPVDASVSSGAAKAQLKVTCMRVADVLSDGPDPSVDPVGYALAQVLPLRRITTSDRALQRDVDTLAAAYEAVYKANNAKGTGAAVDRAGKNLDTICPGAF
jgi:hypothetical protein